MIKEVDHKEKIQHKMVELKNSVEENEFERTTNSFNLRPNNSNEEFGYFSIGEYPI